jgi:hypothetical protein
MHLIMRRCLSKGRLTPWKPFSEQAPAAEPFSAQLYLPAQLNEENAATKKETGVVPVSIEIASVCEAN